ncbi:hypothetical protein GCM10029976_049380 [Kribbella albertanoniae]
MHTPDRNVQIEPLHRHNCPAAPGPVRLAQTARTDRQVRHATPLTSFPRSEGTHILAEEDSTGGCLVELWPERATWSKIERTCDLIPPPGIAVDLHWIPLGGTFLPVDIPHRGSKCEQRIR